MTGEIGRLRTGFQLGGTFSAPNLNLNLTWKEKSYGLPVSNGNPAESMFQLTVRAPQSGIGLRGFTRLVGGANCAIQIVLRLG